MPKIARACSVSPRTATPKIVPTIGVKKIPIMPRTVPARLNSTPYSANAMPVPTAPSMNNAPRASMSIPPRAKPTIPYGNDNTEAMTVIHNIGANEPYFGYIGWATLAATA